MKQDQYVFFLLVLAAAIVLGTTFGVVNSYLTIHSNPNLNHVLKQSTPTKSSTMETSSKTSSESVPEIKIDLQNEPQIESETSTYETGDNEQSYVLTANEADEVRFMLSELGYSKSDLNDNISSFRKDHKMSESKSLDQNTLDLIIQHVTFKKAQALAYNR
ncbi:MAG: hypothetical protein ACM3MK_05640 [Chitinophagales bacterium]